MFESLRHDLRGVRLGSGQTGSHETQQAGEQVHRHGVVAVANRLSHLRSGTL